jgi:shikimate dehydrogenase
MSNAFMIDGATRLYAIVGDPIEQVRSPQTFTPRFVEAGINAILVPLHVPSDRFEAVVPALQALGNLDGLIATVPFKARIVPFASRLGITANTIGALNALRREADGTWSGEMFDGAGFVRAAEIKGERLRGRRVGLFGAGGAGSAIACALAEAGVQSIAVIDIDARRADALVQKLRAAFPNCALRTASSKPDDVDMIVNASTVGMRLDDGLPGEIGRLSPDTLVGDVINKETPTPLIRRAIECGCRYVEGRDMHNGQLDAIMHFFTSVPRRD